MSRVSLSATSSLSTPSEGSATGVTPQPVASRQTRGEPPRVVISGTCAPARCDTHVLARSSRAHRAGMRGGFSSKFLSSDLAKGEWSPASPSAASWPDSVALAISSERSSSVCREKPRKPPPAPKPRVGHCGKGLLRQASSSTICCGAGPAAANSASSSTRAERGLVGAFDLHVGRRHHVLAVDLHAVAGVVDERDFGVLRLALEGLERIEQIGAVEIVMLGDLKAVIPQLGGDRLGVADRDW